MTVVGLHSEVLLVCMYSFFKIEKSNGCCKCAQMKNNDYIYQNTEPKTNYLLICLLALDSLFAVVK